MSGSLVSLPTGTQQKERDGEGSHNADGQPRRRVAIACQRCRKRKIKCSGEGDPRGCASCLQAPEEGVQCNFYRMGTIHEFTMSDRDDHKDKLRQSTAVQSPTSPWSGSDYQYDAVTADHLQRTTYIDRSRSVTNPVGYSSPMQSSSEYSRSGPNIVHSPGTNGSRPYEGRQSAINSRGVRRPMVSLGYENPGAQNLGPHPSTPYDLLADNMTGPGWVPGQALPHGLPAVRGIPESMGIDSSQPTSGQNRHLPLPDTIRSSSSTVIQPDYNPRGSFTYHTEIVPTGSRDHLIANNVPSRSMRLNSSEVTSAYQESFTAPFGCAFDDTNVSSTTSPSSASMNVTFATRRYMNQEPQYAPSPTTQSPALFDPHASRRESAFHSYSFSPDPSRNPVYASNIPADYCNTLVSGHRYIPLPSETQPNNSGIHGPVHGPHEQSRTAYAPVLTARGHRGSMY